ncbi:MAG: WecB/TagA/CpsF family glycosyltransferase [Methylomonas sp.]|jgi:N-acetylglucosaminyldiphosphoundecaprenol N-acetyl-beta-D-mannosaminyltransferase
MKQVVPYVKVLQIFLAFAAFCLLSSAHAGPINPAAGLNYSPKDPISWSASTNLTNNAASSLNSLTLPLHQLTPPKNNYTADLTSFSAVANAKPADIAAYIVANSRPVKHKAVDAPAESAPVPVPASAVLFGSALTGAAGLSRWRRRVSPLLANKRNHILGSRFANLTGSQAINLFQEWVISKQAHQVCFVNVHTLVTGLNDPELRAINDNSLNAMDGLPLVWYSRLVRGNSKATRLCGPDLMLKCLDEGRKRDWSHFFLGGSEQTLQDLVQSVRGRYPGVDIAGWNSPPFRTLSEQEDAQLVELINATKPDFLWVGLGAPKQEKWIAAHLDRIKAPVQLGVGAAFNFHSGHVKRAPRWMQKSGLEWLYRVMTETRLFKRYLTTNPIFLGLLIRDFLLIRLLRLRSV